MTVATTEQLTATPTQQTATPTQQVAAPEHIPSKKVQLPRFNNRVMVNYDDRQIQNIEILKRKLGGSDNSTLRTAVDVFAYLNGLPVETDPSIFINNFLLLNAQNQNGDTHHER